LNRLFSIADIPGFRVIPENEVPGFRVKPQDFVPGFNLTENGVPRQEGNWSDGNQPGSMQAHPELAETLASPAIDLPWPSSNDSDQPPPQELPDWLRNLLTMPPPTVSRVLNPEDAYPFGPPTSVSPSLGSVEAPAPDQRSSFDTSAQLADIIARSGAATAQGSDSPPAAQVGMLTAWPQPLKDGWPYAQAADAQLQDPRRLELARQATDPSPGVSVRPSADSNFNVANGGDDGERQRLLPQALQTQQKVLPLVLETGLSTWSPGADARSSVARSVENAVSTDESTNTSPTERSVYNPDNDAGDDSLFQLVGVKENKAQGDAAEDAEEAATMKAHPGARLAKQVRIYAEGAPDYMVADIMFNAGGTAAIMIVEVKSGDGKLTPKQIAKLGEAARTGNIYIVNEEAAGKFRIQPNVTFAAQGIIPQVFVVGGNHDEIARQLRNHGLEVLPERVGRNGRPARLRIGVPPT
jgi:hypothetical protein